MNIIKLKKRSNCHCTALSFGALISLGSAPLIAADDELFFEMPMVLSSNRLEQPVADAAVSITVIDQETIKASGARSIPEVLRLVPGMQVGYSGNEFGSEPKYVVAYHGHSDEYSKQMQVLIDGRSIYDPFIGGINWKANPVNINDIERIEISRGPNMATYGSNSFQAAINIITRTAAEDQGSFVQSNLGTNDIADLTYRYGGSKGKLDYRITGSTYNDAGLDSANEFDYVDDTKSNNLDYRLDYQINNNNSLSYQGGFGRNTQQADKNQDGLIPNTRTVDNDRFFQFIKWENAIDEKNTLLVQYYYNLNDKEDISQTVPINIPPADVFSLDINDSIKTERHNLELTHFIIPSDSLKLVWGLSAQADIVRAPLYLGTDNDVKSNQFRGFANVEWSINKSNIINFGALAEKNDFTDTELSPRISFTHSFNDQHRIRIGVSRAIRSPFIFEAKANRFYTQEVTVGGNPIGLTLLDQAFLGGETGNFNLYNEKILSREIAYYGNFFKTALLFNARLFHDNINDFIDTFREDVTPVVPEDNVPNDVNNFGDPNALNTFRVYQNRIESTTTGLELELDYHIDSSLRLIASGAIVNLSSNDISIQLSAPQHSFSLLLSKQFNEKYSGSLGYYYVEAFKWTDARGTTDDASTDDYQTLDLRASRNFKFGRTYGSLSLVIKDLLDNYSDYQGEPSNATAPVVIYSTQAYIDFRLNF